MPVGKTMTRMGSNRKTCLIALARVVVISFTLVSVSSAACGQEIRVKFLDGRTGRAVTYEGATVWVGTHTRFLVAPAHNKEGTANFLYTGHSIKAIWPRGGKVPNVMELTISPGSERIAASPEVAAGICWDPGPDRFGPWYQISEILQHGAVSQNRCGKVTANAEPGELILFIRPLSIWQRLIDGFHS